MSLNARVLYTGKQYADNANTQQLPSWTRVDIGARYLVDIGNNRLLTLRARVDNLFNKSYWASAGGYPGFGYLTGLDPRLSVPRLETSRTRVPAGSVAIAGEYSGVYPRPSPGGWRLVGRTDLTLFDPERDPPALLMPGARVRLREVAGP